MASLFVQQKSFKRLEGWPWELSGMTAQCWSFLGYFRLSTLSSVLTVYWEKLRCPGGTPCGVALRSRVQSRSRKQFSWESRDAALLGSFVSQLYHTPPRGHTCAPGALLIHVGLFRGLRGCGIIGPAWPTRSLQLTPSLSASLWLPCGHYHRESGVCPVYYKMLKHKWKPLKRPPVLGKRCLLGLYLIPIFLETLFFFSKSFNYLVCFVPFSVSTGL